MLHLFRIEISDEFAELNVQPIDSSPQFAASSVHFDSSCELLWVGNQGVCWLLLVLLFILIQFYKEERALLHWV